MARYRAKELSRLSAAVWKIRRSLVGLQTRRAAGLTKHSARRIRAILRSIEIVRSLSASTVGQIVDGLPSLPRSEAVARWLGDPTGELPDANTVYLMTHDDARQMSSAWLNAAQKIEDKAAALANVVKKDSQPRRRRRTLPSDRTLTKKEIRVLQAVGKSGGNIAKAARELGKHRTTVREQYDNAMAKIGRKAKAEFKASLMPLPADNRGQLSVGVRDPELLD